MIFPKQTPDLLKAALIKTSEGNTVVAKLMRHAGSSNAGLQNMDSEGRHHHKGYGDHRGKYEHHKNKYYGDHDDDHKDDSHEDEPGIGAEFQTRGFVLAVKDFPVSPTMNEGEWPEQGECLDMDCWRAAKSLTVFVGYAKWLHCTHSVDTQVCLTPFLKFPFSRVCRCWCCVWQPVCQWRLLCNRLPLRCHRHKGK